MHHCTYHEYWSICTIGDFMQKFIKQSELQAANSPAKIARLNVFDAGIHLATADIDVGFAAIVTHT